MIIRPKYMKTKSNAFLILFIVVLSGNLMGQKDQTDRAMEEVFGEKIEMPSEYSFNKSVTMELSTNSNASGNSTMVYLMRYQDDNSCVGMTPLNIDGKGPEVDATTVVDFNQMKMVTFMETESSKMATIYPIREDQITKGKALAEESPTFKETGVTKEVLGYLCKEYKITSTELKGTVWLAPEIEINLTKSFGALGLQFELGDQGPENDPRGFIMEFEISNKTTKSSTNMKVINVELNNSHTLSTDGYIFTTMPVVEEEHKE